MVKQLILIKLTLLTLLFSACDNSKVRLVNDNISPEAKSLVEKSNNLINDIEAGRVMNRSTRFDKEAVISNIKNLQQAILRLDANPNDTNQLIRMARSFTNLSSENIQVLQQDQGILDVFLDPAREFYSRRMQTQERQGLLSTNQLTQANSAFTWSLFRDNFTAKDILILENPSEPEQPYKFPVLDNFSLRYHLNSTPERPQDRSFWGPGTTSISPTNGDYVQVASGQRGSNGSWMLTTCDLSGVTSPTFQIAHQFQISKNSSQVTSAPQEIVRDTFQIYASTNYAGGNPGNPKNNPEWVNLNIVDYGNLPAGVDFHRVISPNYDLSPFTNQLVTIGFYYDFDRSTHGGHYLSWRIDQFELFGNAVGKVECTDPDLVFDIPAPAWPQKLAYFWSFPFSGVLDDLQQFNMEGANPAKFFEHEHNGEKYIRISGFKDKADGINLLTTPTTDLSENEKPEISVIQAGNFYTPEAQKENLFKIYIAEENNSVTDDKLDWILLDFKVLPPWKDYIMKQTEWLPVPSELKGKKVKVGFAYQSIADKGFFPLWQIHEVIIRNAANPNEVK